MSFVMTPTEITFLFIFIITWILILTVHRNNKGMLVDFQIEDRAYYNGMIEPYIEKQLQPASYDLRLEDAEKWILQPGESTLGSTEEFIRIPKDLVGIVYGKSSIAREFLNVHYAGFIDPGFNGNIVLEFTNNSDQPIDLHKYKTICQIAFFRLSRIPEKIYGQRNNHYQNQRGIVKSHYGLSVGRIKSDYEDILRNYD